MYLNDIKINNIKDTASLEDNLLHLVNYDKPSIVVTFNLDFLRISFQNSRFKEICQRAKIVLADGIGITILLKLKYGRSIKRITGNDLFKDLLKIADKRKLKIALVGSTQQSLSKIKNKCASYFPGISFLLLSPPYYFEKDKLTNDNIINQLKVFQPDILVIALGCPRQELWISENMELINAKINVGVGSTLDFYSGLKKRSPLFLQRIGLEWLWRLLNEPKRLFKRYILDDFPFFLKSVFGLLFNKSAL